MDRHQKHGRATSYSMYSETAVDGWRRCHSQLVWNAVVATLVGLRLRQASKKISVALLYEQVAGKRYHAQMVWQAISAIISVATAYEIGRAEMDSLTTFVEYDAMIDRAGWQPNG